MCALLIVFLTFVATATEALGCSPGHSDGIWETIGPDAPSADTVLKTLVGTELAKAEGLLRKPPDATLRGSRYWIYEMRRKSAYRTCVEPDEVTYAQNFFVVRATVRDDVIADCDVQFRNVDGTELVSPKQLLVMPSGVLDDPLHVCKKREVHEPLQHR